MNRFLYALLCYCLFVYGNAAQGIVVYKDSIYTANIKSLLVYKQGWQLSYPIIKLDSGEKITISFDLMGADIQDYNYNIVHCNADWQPSGLMSNEYMTGFGGAAVTNYRRSFNTRTEYVHYQLELSNDDVQLTASGNYVVVVYQNYNPDDIVLTACFAVVEPKIEINAQAKRPTLAQYMDQGQEIDFSIKHPSYRINDAFSELKIVITQNNRRDNAITGLKPLFVRNGELIYDYNDINVFDGGSEFRYFDCKSVRYRSDRVSDIFYEAPMYHFVIINDELRTQRVYLYNQDLNGKYAVEVQEGDDDEVEADYVQVHFTFPYPEMLSEANFYVTGNFNNWNCNQNNRMVYDIDQKAYIADITVKQGYYNYAIAYLAGNGYKQDISYAGGNYYQTENDYIVYIYHRQATDRADRLIGFQICNSLQRY